jgi:hypothetical protein
MTSSVHAVLGTSIQSNISLLCMYCGQQVCVTVE